MTALSPLPLEPEQTSLEVLSLPCECRLRMRAVRIVKKLTLNYDDSFPHAMGNEVDAKRLYEFLSNESVTYEALSAVHGQQTAARCVDVREVVVAHDIMEIAMRASAKGTGRLREASTRGYLGLFSLTLSAQGGAPLGALHSQVWTRPETPRNKTTTGTRRSGASYQEFDDLQSKRGWLSIQACEQALQGSQTSAIHVADREAGMYALLHAMVSQGLRFVIRMKGDRSVYEAEGVPTRVLRSLMQATPVVLHHEVKMHPRAKNKSAFLASKRTHSAGDTMRTATVAYSARRLWLRRPSGLTHDFAGQPLADTLEVNIVYSLEPNPPAGCKRIEWLQVTSEPIETPKELEQVVSLYQRRWLIEEYFLALKEGTHLEERPMKKCSHSRELLALFLPIAWPMLALRHAARSELNRPARSILRPSQLAVLRAHNPVVLSRIPRAEEVMLAIAQMGGYLSSNRSRGGPGMKTLRRGLERLLILELGYLTAQENKLK